jgi:hypothetical protein
VRQPWAWLLFHGKSVENRDWRTFHRGPLAITASKGVTRAEYLDAVEFVQTFDADLAKQIPPIAQLVRGAVVGTVRQVGCVIDHPSPWFQGRFGHVYDQAREFAVPIPCAGNRGLWNWEPPCELSELWRPV